jgi:hypothetical protein
VSGRYFNELGTSNSEQLVAARGDFHFDCSDEQFPQDVHGNPVPQTLDWYRHPSRFKPVNEVLKGSMYFVSPSGLSSHRSRSLQGHRLSRIFVVLSWDVIITVLYLNDTIRTSYSRVHVLNDLRF